MRTGLSFHGLMGAVLIAVSVAPARAADPTLEIGASLVTATVGQGKDSGSVFGVPSGGFGGINPGVYASIFVNKRVAIEPQLGFVWVTGQGHSAHVLNFGGQLNLFLREADGDSPYVFGGAGLIDTSDGSITPKFASVGGGYRIRAGGRLTFRLDGRFAHYTDGVGNTLIFGLSIGGLLGKQ
jgi:hypothetical protein